MANQQLKATSFDVELLKQSLIEYMKTKEEFSDFDYEGSAINTIIDLLVRDSHYSAYLANMLANESFLSTAQIRGNVVSHAQKLSYKPKSKTASRAIVNLKVIPTGELDEFIIRANPGVTFIGSDSTGTSYSFTTLDSISLSYNNSENAYLASDIDLYQGQRIVNRFSYNRNKITIPNRNVDTSTLSVKVINGNSITYNKADSLTNLGPREAVYFLRESPSGHFEIDFGKDVLGFEPAIGSEIILTYINTEDQIANGAITLVPAFSIGGFSNIQVDVVNGSYGGSDRESTESIRLNAPRTYQNQDRALSPFDYGRIVKDEFTFIDSVITWGGEDNTPPRYGNVFISILPQKGLTITRSLRSRIEAAVRRKGVGSVTPVVVTPNLFNIDVSIKYSYNRSLTDLNQKSIEDDILSTVSTYLKSIRSFGSYFNQSQLISDLKSKRYIETVLVDEALKTELDILSASDTYYSVNFLNSIVPGSFKIENFSSLKQNERIYDVNGTIVHEWQDSTTRTKNIGEIDYDTGEIEFQFMFIQPEPTVTVSCVVDGENIYVEQNNVLQGGNIKVEEIIR